MPAPANVVRATLGSRRGNADDRLYARATPEKVEIAETYSVTQEISKNPRSEPGTPTGRIEMVIPYDGGDYFTRQAVGDVERAVAVRGQAGPRTAIMGHLLIADHRRTDLYQSMRQHGEVGVIPLEVPVTSADGTTGRLTSDRRASVMSYDYAPRLPELYPIDLDVRLLDPDIVDLEWDWLLDAFDVDPADLIKGLTQEARFKSELFLMIQVHLTLPVKKGQLLEPMVKRVSIGWPTVTSIATTQLAVLAPHDPQLRRDTRRPDYEQRPIRYNPVERRLEWENVDFFQPGDRSDDQDVVNCTYSSAQMQLIIGHPGELFAAERLTVHAEVEVPGYLLSGVEARLYGATGNRVPADPGRALPELMTRVNATATLQLDDAFAKRRFAPYHQVVFDEVVPDETRIARHRHGAEDGAVRRGPATGAPGEHGRVQYTEMGPASAPPQGLAEPYHRRRGQAALRRGARGRTGPVRAPQDQGQRVDQALRVRRAAARPPGADPADERVAGGTAGALPPAPGTVIPRCPLRSSTAHPRRAATSAGRPTSAACAITARGPCARSTRRRPSASVRPVRPPAPTRPAPQADLARPKRRSRTVRIPSRRAGSSPG